MVESVGVYGTSSSTYGSGTDEVMGKDSFLKLLVTQLQNQDPLNPMDNTEFVAQLAQFSSLEGIQNLNTTMTGVAGSLTSMQEFASTGLIGRIVKAEAGALDFDGSTQQVLGFRLDGSASSAQLTITDSYGLPVRSMDLGAAAAGDHEVTWDGTDNNGIAVPAGTYAFSVSAMDSNGSPAGVSATYLLGYVTGVSLEDGGASIFVNSTAVSRDSVKEIY